MDIGAASNNEERESTFRFLNDEISQQHERLFAQANEMDRKATMIAGFAAAAITFLLGGGRGSLWSASLGFYGAALVLAFGVLWPRRWEGLSPTALHARLSEAAPVFVIGRVAGTKVEIFEKNWERARIKRLLWIVSAIFFAGATGLAITSGYLESIHE